MDVFLDKSGKGIRQIKGKMSMSVYSTR